jgi:hypothetical protein
MGGESRGGESNRTGQERLSGICGAVAFVPQTHLHPSDIVNAWRRYLTQCRRRRHTETAFSLSVEKRSTSSTYSAAPNTALNRDIASLILRFHIFAATGNSVLSVKLHFPHICSKFITRGRSSASSVNSIFYEFCPRQKLAAGGAPLNPSNSFLRHLSHLPARNFGTFTASLPRLSPLPRPL